MASRGVSWDTSVHSIQDLKYHGSRRLPKMYRDYFNEGAMDLLTVKENEEAYDYYKIQPRVLVNVDNVDISGEIFGFKTALPLGFSPAAMHGLAHPDGEIATSRAAAKMGICMGLSSYATASLEDVISQGAGNPYVMQLCILKDRSITLQILQRAESAGYKAIFLSADTPCLGRRLNEYRNNFSLPDGMSWPNLLSDGKSELRASSDQIGKSDEVPAEPSKHDYDPSVDWDSLIPWMRQHTKLQIWVKGIYGPEDVRAAIKHGLDGVVISNHGGRQLDGVPASIDILRQCAPVARGKIPITVDGGIRRGTDIFKALALGASHCFVGRIPIWGLAYDGQDGVELALKILMYEFKVAMLLAGCRSIKDITQDHLVYKKADGLLAKL
ncbi:Oxidase FUB9 [Colletotrichum gloeosporioides]|uniref:Oxidase FUB9 n=1 Tax=Colletotrichum gloeosporioides TaxID=474922 RepID=A0A8H4CCZ4_COLGL|nr:Oxidase FUB9 [Colletotrichum gloeosporioides]KAF3801748.1 Oxidase FUB9 [Colletotrichum gloeosporioides]